MPGGKRCAVNQVLYHLGSRGIEYVADALARGDGAPVMAYVRWHRPEAEDSGCCKTGRCAR